MKPALFFSIARDPYGRTWHVVGVTTIADFSHGQWWGRYVDGRGASHGRVKDLRGRFSRPERAAAMLGQVQDMEDERRAENKRFEDERKAMNRSIDARIATLINAAQQADNAD